VPISRVCQLFLLDLAFQVFQSKHPLAGVQVTSLQSPLRLRFADPDYQEGLFPVVAMIDVTNWVALK
jgi:hypothetical protein